MSIEDASSFKKIEDALGNKYAAVMWISKMARKKGHDKKQFKLLESKLIQWVLTGKSPYSSFELGQRRILNDVKEVDAVLEWVSDDEVCREVRRLYTKSVRENCLCMYTDDDISLGKKDRINILIRMIWL